MSDTRESLEAKLVREPFNSAARAAYADLLAVDNDFTGALAQWELLIQQTPDAAAPYLGAARTHLSAGDAQAAARRYQQAREKTGFVPDPALEPAAAPSRLKVLSGGAQSEVPAEVVPITASGVVRFSDVVGMDALKKTIRLRIIEPFVKPGLFARFGKKSGGGILLYGPPGCGKTLIARAIAGECKATFLSVGISDVLNMWMGESERNLAALFEKARAQKPAVLFFDELDALAFSRSKASSEHTRTRVNEFLNQLDGLAGDNDRVLVLAATNMPWDVDPAMKRPGRFDRHIFVPPPDSAARAEMFRHKLTTVPTEGVDHARLAQLTEHCSGADIDGVIDAAKERVLSEILDGSPERPLAHGDLLEAAKAVQPSTLEWLRTARNLVKYAGADSGYRDVEAYLKSAKLL